MKISDTAAKRIKELCMQHDAAFVRLAVDGGGCSGFQYVFGFGQDMEPDDRAFEYMDAKLVIDETSLQFVDGSVLEFIDDLSGAHFKVNNPHATSSCGCGTSFAV